MVVPTILSDTFHLLLHDALAEYNLVTINCVIDPLSHLNSRFSWMEPFVPLEEVELCEDDRDDWNLKGEKEFEIVRASRVSLESRIGHLKLLQAFA